MKTIIMLCLIVFSGTGVAQTPIDSTPIKYSEASKELQKQSEKITGVKILGEVQFLSGLCVMALTLYDAAKTESVEIPKYNSSGKQTGTTKIDVQHKWTMTHTIEMLLSSGLIFSAFVTFRL